MTELVTRRECDLTKEAMKANICAEIVSVKAEIKALRREIVIAVTASTATISLIVTLISLIR